MESPTKNISHAGFTLIELLAVIAIIGILAAIGIQNYKSYRQRGFDARSIQDLRIVALAEEAYFTDNSQYVSCTSASDCMAHLPAIATLSDGTVIAMTGTTSGFTGTSTHPSGSRTYAWDSSAGGMQ